VFTGIIYPMLGFQNTALSFFYFFCVTLQYLMLYVAFGSVGVGGVGIMTSCLGLVGAACGSGWEACLDSMLCVPSCDTFA